MRNRSIVALVALLSLSSAAVAADETWNVSEGASGNSRGVWHLKLDREKITGNAAMTMQGGRSITFNVTGERKGDEVVMQRASSSDGSRCAYRGRTERDGTIRGTALCGSNASAWVATKR